MIAATKNALICLAPEMKIKKRPDGSSFHRTPVCSSWSLYNSIRGFWGVLGNTKNICSHMTVTANQLTTGMRIHEFMGNLSDSDWQEQRKFDKTKQDRTIPKWSRHAQTSMNKSRGVDMSEKVLPKLVWLVWQSQQWIQTKEIWSETSRDIFIDNTSNHNYNRTSLDHFFKVFTILHQFMLLLCTFTTFHWLRGFLKLCKLHPF